MGTKRRRRPTLKYKNHQLTYKNHVIGYTTYNQQYDSWEYYLEICDFGAGGFDTREEAEQAGIEDFLERRYHLKKDLKDMQKQAKKWLF
jgi:hypothetical protein